MFSAQADFVALTIGKGQARLFKTVTQAFASAPCHSVRGVLCTSTWGFSDLFLSPQSEFGSLEVFHSDVSGCTC